VIYLTGHCSVSISVKAMKSGAIDFLEKPVDEALLFPAIETAINRHSRARADQAKLDAMQARLMKLSAREREVMDHVIAGRLNKQIAIDMGIAEKTVKVHRGRVMKKMEVRSVAQLVQLCDDLGIRRTA
jgi:FixJ family two-component response regulator